MKKILACVLALAMVFGGYALGEEEVETLVIGTNAELSPFEYQGEDGYISGFDAELMRLILLVLDYDCRFVTMDYDELLPALAEGRVNLVISALSVTEETQGKALFSNAYMSAAQKMIVSADGAVEGAADLAGGKIGVGKGRAGEQYARENAEGAEVVPYDRISEAVADLAEGKLDAVITDADAAEVYADQFENLKICDTALCRSSYVIAAAPGNAGLMDKVNAALSSVKSLGYFDSLCVYWFGAAR